MTEEGEEAAAEFVIPYFDLVVVSACADEGLEEVEVYATDWAIVFFESVDYCSYAVVPSVIELWW